MSTLLILYYLENTNLTNGITFGGRSTNTWGKSTGRDSFRSKELELLVQEKNHVEKRVTQLSEEVIQLRSELTRVSGSAKDKTEALSRLEEKLQQAENRLTAYESMSFWDWLRTYFTRK